MTFFGCIEALHLFFKDFVDVSNVEALILKLSCKSRQLIPQNNHFAFQILLFFIWTSVSFTDFSKLALLSLNLSFSAPVVFFFTFKTGLVSLKFTLFIVKNVLVHAKGLTFFRDKRVSSSWVLNSLLPLQIKLMAFLMQPFEFFSCFVKLNLSGLCLSDFLFEFFGFAANFNGKFFNLQG